MRTWRRSMTPWTMPWVWGFTDCGKTRCSTSCTPSPGWDSWMWPVEQVKQLLCIFYIPSNLNLTSLTYFCCCDYSPFAGDIAFRFLEYVRFQQERQKRRAARSMQAPSWQDISNNYSTEEEDGPQESRAVVCDINKEMLRVGKQKADGLGISAGELW